MEEKENRAVKAVTLKLTPEVYENYQRVQAEVDAPTVNQFMDTLLTRFFDPVKNNQENEKKLKENDRLIQELKQQLADYCAKDAELAEKLTVFEEKTENDTGEIIRLQEENTRLKSENSQLIEKGKLPENCKVIQFDPLNLLLLQYVADREGRKRGQEWSIHDVINYFIHNRFEMGSVNGNMDAVPDSAVREFKSMIEC